MKRNAEASELKAALITSGCKGVTRERVALLKHWGNAAQKLAEDECNREPKHPSEYHNRAEGILLGVRAVLARLYAFGITAKLTGDPRGYCLRLYGLRRPDGTPAYNTWGGAESGWGV